MTEAELARIRERADPWCADGDDDNWRALLLLAARKPKQYALDEKYYVIEGTMDHFAWRLRTRGELSRQEISGALRAAAKGDALTPEVATYIADTVENPPRKKGRRRSEDAAMFYRLSQQEIGKRAQLYRAAILEVMPAWTRTRAEDEAFELVASEYTEHGAPLKSDSVRRMYKAWRRELKRFRRRFGLADD